MPKRIAAAILGVAAAGFLCSHLLPELSAGDAGTYSGTLLGATASALGVVFVFVFALVEATLSGREAQSVGTFTEVLNHSGATWTLGISCMALGLNGMALSASLISGAAQSVSSWALWVVACGAVSSAAALCALTASVVLTIRVLAPGELSRRFQARIRSESRAAVALEAYYQRLGAAFLETLHDWSASDVALPIRSWPHKIIGGNHETVIHASPANHDRRVSDVDLRGLYAIGLEVAKKGGALLVRQPGGGMLRPDDAWLASSDARAEAAPWPNPYRLERADAWPYREMLLTVYHRAVRAIRAEDPVGLDDAMRHIASGFEGVIVGRRSVRGPADKTYWMADPPDGVLSKHADRLREIWSRVDLGDASWDLVSPVATAWLEMASAALDARDEIVLTRLMDEFSASAHRRFGQKGSVPGMLVETLLRFSRIVFHQVEEAEHPDELDAVEPAVAILLQGWCGAVLAAVDAADSERYEMLLQRLHSYIYEPGFRCDHAARDATLGDGVEEPAQWIADRVAWAKRKVAFCRTFHDAYLLMRFSAVAKVARNLTVNPRRDDYGRPQLGPTTRESIARFVRAATPSLEDLARGCRLATDVQHLPAWVQRVAERPWDRIEDMGHTASLMHDAAAGFFLGGLYVSSPQLVGWGEFAENDDLGRLRELNKVHPGYLNERAADLHLWPIELLPEDAYERAEALLRSTTSRPDILHDPSKNSYEAPYHLPRKTIGPRRPAG